MNEEEKSELSSEDLDRISRLQLQKESPEAYKDRPVWQRVLAWILLVILIAGIGLYCYWQMVPQG